MFFLQIKWISFKITFIEDIDVSAVLIYVDKW